MNMSNIVSKNVKILMEQRGINQSDLSRGANIHHTQVSKNLLGERQWQTKHIEAVAKYFNVSYASLLAENGESVNQCTCQTSKEEAKAIGNVLIVLGQLTKLCR